MSRMMTRQGYEAIQAEIAFLWSEERPRIVKQVTAAAELGDRSENAAYIYGKKRLREIDSRLRYLRRKIEGVKVVDLAEIPPSDRVQFGAKVTVEDDEGRTRTWRLVGRDESDPKRGWISVESPVGRALMGLQEGDAVEVKLPRGTTVLEVLEIAYGPDEPST